MRLGKQKRKVRIYIKDGPSIEGIMEGRTRHVYIIWAPKLVQDDAKEPLVEVSGHVEIPRENVVWYQVVG